MNIQKNKNNAQSWHKIFVTLISWFYVCTPKQRKALKRAKKSTQKDKKKTDVMLPNYEPMQAG